MKRATVSILLTFLGCCAGVLLAQSETASVGAPNSFQVNLDWVGPIDWTNIKVFDDQVYVFFQSGRRLKRFDRSGSKTLDLDLQQNWPEKELHHPKSFGVAPDGKLLFLARTRLEPGSAVASFDVDGRLEPELALESGDLEILKIAAGPLGDIHALALPNGMRRFLVKETPTSKVMSVLYSCEPGGSKLESAGRLFLPRQRRKLPSFVADLDLSVLAVDLHSNVYFSTPGVLQVATRRGKQFELPFPRPGELLQIVESIVSNPSGGILVVLREGENMASEQEKADGLWLLANPSKRVLRLEYDGGGTPSGFTEVYFGDDKATLLGVFSDGAWVQMDKLRNRVVIREENPKQAPK